MKETELNKVLNYMKQYVENKYEHDSEPMLTYKDLQLVLEEIEELKAEIKELNDDNVWWTNRFNAIKKEHIDTITRNEEYRARIDKAIEYIRTHRYPTNYCFSKEDLDKQDLINILEGE